MSSRESRVTGQLTDGSRGSRVKKCDPVISALVLQAKGISCFGWEVRQKLRVLEYL